MKQSLQLVIDDFKKEEVSILRIKYGYKEDSSGWNFSDAKNSLLSDLFFQMQIQYRPFDIRETIVYRKTQVASLVAQDMKL